MLWWAACFASIPDLRSCVTCLTAFHDCYTLPHRHFEAVPHWPPPSRNPDIQHQAVITCFTYYTQPPIEIAISCTLYLAGTQYVAEA